MEKVSATASSNWQSGLPILSAGPVVLREVRAGDAMSLLALQTTEEVRRFLAPPPTTLDGFERFIGWSIRQRAAGESACYAVTLQGADAAIGIFQVRRLHPAFENAEWGFTLGSPFWGAGIFQAGARLVIDFAFDTIGARRLEARAAVLNGRGNSALLKLGAVREAVLRGGFRKDGQQLDQALYAILAADRATSRKACGTGRPVAPAILH